MGQLFNRSKMSLLEGMMLQKIQNFTGKLKMYIGETIDCGRACRALEADIICKSRPRVRSQKKNRT